MNRMVSSIVTELLRGSAHASHADPALNPAAGVIHGNGIVPADMAHHLPEPDPILDPGPETQPFLEPPARKRRPRRRATRTRRRIFSHPLRPRTRLGRRGWLR